MQPTTKKVESTLHTKIVAQATVGAAQILASNTLSSTIASTIKNSASISNSVETEKNFFMKLTDCSAGVYVYQTKVQQQIGG